MTAKQIIVVALITLVGAIGVAQILAADADAFTVGVHDQGADPTVVTTIADQLGARTVRIVATPQAPHANLVQDYRARGLQVQAAIIIKRQTTVGDIRSTIRAWRGAVRTVSVGNEVELNGVPACTYMRLFRAASQMIRREFPGVKVGFGEFSPIGALEYLQRVGRCAQRAHVRLRASFVAAHPYSFTGDPLAPPVELTGVPGASWLGIGNLSKLTRAVRDARSWLRVSERLPRCTEFAYLVSGRYSVGMTRAATLWPRAVKQARKVCGQLVIYGLGVVHDQSTWGSAALLDRFGRGTPAMQALARALGRVWRDRQPPIAPAGDLITPLPDGTEHRDQPLTLSPAVAASTPDLDPEGAEGAQVEDPTVVPEPSNSEGTDAPADPPPPVSDGPVASSDGPEATEPDAPAAGETSP